MGIYPTPPYEWTQAVFTDVTDETREKGKTSQVQELWLLTMGTVSGRFCLDDLW